MARCQSGKGKAESSVVVGEIEEGLLRMQRRVWFGMTMNGHKKARKDTKRVNARVAEIGEVLPAEWPNVTST